MRQQARF